MNYSGILVVSTAAKLDALVDTLAAMPDIDIYHLDREQCRFIVVQEAASVDEEIAGLKRIKKLSGVVLAEMVYHYFGEGEPGAARSVTELSDAELSDEQLDLVAGGLSAEAAEYLNK